MQIRCLLEGVEPEDMLQSWHDMLPEYMQRWNLDRAKVGASTATDGSCRQKARCTSHLQRRHRRRGTQGGPQPLPLHPHQFAFLPLQLVDLFGSTRDEWMAADLEGWLAPNRIYPGVAEAMQALMQAHEVYIVTTKQVGQRAALQGSKIVAAVVAAHAKTCTLQNPSGRRPWLARQHLVPIPAWP